MPSETGLEQTRRARGLVSSRVSGRRVHAARHRPPSDLRDQLETGWSGAWDLPVDAPHTTEMLSDPSVHIVCESGGVARVVGPWSQLWMRQLEGTGIIRGIKLHPGAVRACFDLPAADLVDRIVPLTELVSEASGLEAQVLEHADEADGVGVLFDWFRRRRRADPRTAQAVALVHWARTTSVTRVDAVADHAGLSVRALQRLFRTHVGLSPKAVVRRFRLQEVAARVENGRASNLGDLAYTLGYADQAHLARDFRAATGRSLTAFEARLDAPPGDGQASTGG